MSATVRDRHRGERATGEAHERERREITVRGVVQGVGFRPFIYGLARRHGLAGWVRNDADGVQIAVEGTAQTLDVFVQAISAEAPPLSDVETVSERILATRGESDFRILESRRAHQRSALVSPDVTTCDDCVRELFDSEDRRFRYPFVNCTNCGPRFTIIQSVPYDRAVTTMAGFDMCAACEREYHDPTDRRFHAQPNACPICGPHVWLMDPQGNDLSSKDPIGDAAALLRSGAILAVKGLGGFHLGCDPFNREAVAALRARKVRQDKPFALMALDAPAASMLCHIDAVEEALLTSPSRPIVLLRKREECDIADEVAPRQRSLGVMLAYTPLHHVLLRDAGIPLVMTSGNRSDEPIAYRDDEALEQLGRIADAFLVHDRPIHMRCDDSVIRIAGGEPYTGRRSRGFAPAPLRLTNSFTRHTLACGGELKNTFCLGKERHAFLSHHVGDLENYETLRSFREGIEHYCRLFDLRPELVAYDLHPEYLSTKYALELEEAGLAAVGVQHHHAHIAACLADNQRPVDERVIGVALDGTGYGADGAIWGGEVFVGSIHNGFARQAHLSYTPLPGGEAAIREPWRMAVAHLLSVLEIGDILKLPIDFISEVGEQNVRVVARLVKSGLNSPPTSSAGRLFDAVSALLGLPGTRRTTYEGQAAIELELAASGSGEPYPVVLSSSDDGWDIETAPIVGQIVEEICSGEAPDSISARFHRTIAEIVVCVCERLRDGVGTGSRVPSGCSAPSASSAPDLTAVALSGGTFQNILLLEAVNRLLETRGFTVYRHSRVPTNDGGLALGQAVLANEVH